MAQPLEYSTGDANRHPARTPLFVALIVIADLVYLLFELQRMPYRPPHDMSTFLGEEIGAVRALMAVLGGVWLVCAIALAMVARHDREPRNTSL